MASWYIGRPALDTPGPDLLGLVDGSEGTLGVVTKATLRLLRRPETVQTLLAAFDSIDAGGAAVSEIIGGGHHSRRGRDDGFAGHSRRRGRGSSRLSEADTVLIVELDGPKVEVT